ncbi:MAG: hypothetical protein L3J11_01675 [Draconibacterium sp.]|nr:hypothetical protein [Draconibacterium sp.]
MEIFSLVVLFVYLGLIVYIIPKRGLEFDLFQVKFSLLPHWFKIVSVVWIVVSIIVAILFSSLLEKSDEYLVSALNLSLFILIFSKQKNEDEFSEQIRFKSFTYSFVSFIALAGAFGAISINRNESGFIFNNLYLHLLVGASMLMSLLYFYITIYKFRKLQ